MHCSTPCTTADAKVSEPRFSWIGKWWKICVVGQPGTSFLVRCLVNREHPVRHWHWNYPLWWLMCSLLARYLTRKLTLGCRTRHIMHRFSIHWYLLLHVIPRTVQWGRMKSFLIISSFLKNIIQKMFIITMCTTPHSKLICYKLKAISYIAYRSYRAISLLV